MSKSSLILLLCCSLLTNYYFYTNTPEAVPDSSSEELLRSQKRISQLENEIRVLKNLTVSSVETQLQQDVEDTQDEKSKDAFEQVLSKRSIDYKISAIRKVIDLKDNEENDLRAGLGSLSPSESDQDLLVEVLGEERAEVYQQARDLAFKRNVEEEVEKESVYLARKLNLSDAQEGEVRVVLGSIEDELNAWRKARAEELIDENGGAPGNKLQIIVEETQARRDMLRARLANVLDAAQFNSFVALEAESSAADMETFHALPGEDEQMDSENAQ